MKPPLSFGKLDLSNVFALVLPAYARLGAGHLSPAVINVSLRIITHLSLTQRLPIGLLCGPGYSLTPDWLAPLCSLLGMAYFGAQPKKPTI